MQKILFGCVPLFFLLTSCVVSYQSAVPKSYGKSQLRLSSRWLQEHEDDIVNAMTNAIRKKHPTTADWFPRIIISSLRAGDSDTEQSINAILSKLRKNLLPDSADSKIWKADLTITAGSPDDLSIVQAMLIPAQVTMCVPSLMIICPCTYKALIILTAEITTDAEETIYFQGAGAVDVWAGTPYVADNPELMLVPHESKAFIGALTSLVDNLVSYAEAQYAINKGKH